MSKKKRNKVNNIAFIESATLNSWTYDDIMSNLERLATSIFEWVNLPDTMSPRWLEENLFFFGQASMLYDDKYEFINTKCNTNGNINIYGLPTALNCFSYGGYQSTRIVYNGLAKPEKNRACIHVLNNYQKMPTVTMLQLYAYRLYECQRSWDTNIKNQKFPLIILTTEEQRLSLENLYSQLDGNKPVIITDKNGFDIESIRAIKTEVPFVADKITKEKKEVWNDILTLLGINNINIEKKERLITSEGDANNELINLNLQSFLIPRQEACKYFNDLYGFKGENEIKVRVRSDLKNIIKQVESSIFDLKDKLNDVEEGELDE